MALVQLHGVVAKGTGLCKTDPPHRQLDCGSMSALISDFPDIDAFETLPPEEIAEWALAHNAILSSYCDDTGVLPMRVGAVFSDEAAVQAEIAMRAATFHAPLAALQTMREYTVQLLIITPAAAPPAQATTGRDHLRARLNHRNQRHSLETDRHALARTILDQISAAAIQVEPAGAPKQGRVLDCVVLIPRKRVHQLRDLAKSLYDPAKSLGLELIIAGPWPPYSFDITALPEHEFENVR